MPFKKKAPKKAPLPKPGYTAGIEFDHLGVRAARLFSEGTGTYAVDRLDEVKGDFSEDAALVEGLRQAKDKLGITPKDSLVCCLSGKQVSAMQIPFRALPPEEMKPALRLEMRKSVSFDLSGATLDYQILGAPVDGDPNSIQVVVALAAAGLLGRQLKMMDAIGLKPAAVDVLPMAVANALWTWVGAPRSEGPLVALHIGPQLSTIVIDGPRSPLFNRYIHFSAEDILGKENAPADKEKRLAILAEEIARSLAYYEKTYFAAGFKEILLLGEYLHSPSLEEQLKRHIGLSIHKMDLPRRLGFSHDRDPGRFDLAVALGMQGET